jgi:spermidine synthase
MNKERILYATIFLSGFAGLMYEVSYAQGITLIIGSSTYATSIVLATFLIGLGIGSLFAKRIMKYWRSSLLYFYVELSIAIAGASFIPIMKAMDNVYPAIYLLGFDNVYSFNMFLLVFTFAILIIPTFFMGLTFPIFSDLVVRSKSIGSDVGRVFSVNTMGGVFGAFMAGYIFIPKLGLEYTLIIAAACNLVVALTVLIIYAGDFRRLIPNIVLISSAVALLVLLSYQKIDHFTTGLYYTMSNYDSRSEFEDKIADIRKKQNILFADFGLYGSIVIQETDSNNLVLRVNGKIDASTHIIGDVPTQLLLGYIPMLLHPNPKEVAVVGLGSGITASAVCNFNINEVDVFEINPLVAEVNHYFNRYNRSILDNEKVNLILADARNYMLASGKSYDVIISEPSNPWLAGEGFLFTKEYYQIARDKLNKDGVFLQWIGAYDFSVRDFKIMLNTINAVFPYIQIWSDRAGSDMYIIASMENKLYDYQHVSQRLQEENIRQDFEIISIGTKSEILQGAELFFSFYIGNQNTFKNYIWGSAINSDNKPIIEFSTARTGAKNESAGHLIAFFDSEYQNESVSITPNFKQDPGAEYSNYFIGLNLGNDLLTAKKLVNNYQYTFSNPEGEEIETDLKLQKFGVFEVDSIPFVIQSKPIFAGEVWELIQNEANGLGANITRVFESNGIMKFELIIDDKIAFMWVCEKSSHLYFISLPTIDNSPENKQKLSEIVNNIGCL